MHTVLEGIFNYQSDDSRALSAAHGVAVREGVRDAAAAHVHEAQRVVPAPGREHVAPRAPGQRSDLPSRNPDA